MLGAKREDELRTAKGAVAPLTHVRGLWHLQVRINNGREFLLVDSGAACHVCPPAWVQRVSQENKHLQSLTRTTDPGELAPIAEDVRAPGPHPVKQDASLAKENDNDNKNDNEKENRAVKRAIVDDTAGAPAGDTALVVQTQQLLLRG